MKTVGRIATAAAVLSMAYVFTRLWLSSMWAEWFWTWLNNQLSAGQNPGLASDVELIVVLVCAFALSVGLVFLSLKAWEATTKSSAS
jgi:hypothetical protein